MTFCYETDFFFSELNKGWESSLLVHYRHLLDQSVKQQGKIKFSLLHLLILSK